MKKLIALILIAIFTIVLHGDYVTADIKDEESLYDILISKEKIKASFEYPSFKIADNFTGTKLNVHTPVIIQNNSEINAKEITSGNTIDFSVVQDVKTSSGEIIIKAGTPVSARIDIEKRGCIGKSAEIKITDFHTTAVDGTYIPLSSTVSVNPDDRMVLSIVLSVCICFLFLLIRGRNAVLPEGTVKTVYTAADIYVNTTSL